MLNIAAATEHHNSLGVSKCSLGYILQPLTPIGLPPMFVT